MERKMNRRNFMKKAAGLGATLINLPRFLAGYPAEQTAGEPLYRPPVVLSTWGHGIPANARAVKTLQDGGSVLDAVEAAVMVVENDPEVRSVGYGGLQDEEGKVTLDACIMDWNWRCGSVAALENIKNPVAVARKVMEITDHVMLVGEGAKTFALRTGFKEENLLTDAARTWWLQWKRSLSSKDDWLMPEDTHDTIGLLALDEEGKMACACTTSGLAGKIHGRVGDSPIIGAGMYVDGEVGGAAATGRGEEVIWTAGSHLVVENMRRGMTPQQACEDALQRIIHIYHGSVDFQVGYIGMNVKGEVGAASLKPGFQYALYADGKNALYDGKTVMAG